MYCKVRGLVYTQAGTVAGQASKAISPVIPHTGWYEIDPDQLWDQVIFFSLHHDLLLLVILTKQWCTD